MIIRSTDSLPLSAQKNEGESTSPSSSVTPGLTGSGLPGSPADAAPRPIRNRTMAWVFTGAVLAAIGVAAWFGAWPALMVGVIAASLTWMLVCRLEEQQRLRAETSQENSRFYRQILDRSPSGMILSDPQGYAVDANRAAWKLYEFSSREELLQANLPLFGTDEEGRRQILKQLMEVGKVVHLINQPISHLRSSETRVLETTTSILRDSQGKIHHLLTNVRDVSEEKRLQQRLAHMTRYDPLTGLPNRSTFHDEIERAIARTSRFGQRIAVMVLELVPGPTENLDYRTLVGTVAERLSRSIRKVDTLARLDEWEFAVIKTDFEEPEHAAKLAQWLLTALEKPLEIDHHSHPISANIGIAIFPPGRADADQLISQAETALYRSRAEGPGIFRFYDEDIGLEVSSRMDLASELRDALKHQHLFLEYQPQVDLTNRRVIGIEALLRWCHPEKGRIDPAQFLNLAESNGLMPAVGSWILRTACAEAKRWQSRQLSPVPIAINLSALQLKSIDLASTVADTLAATGLAPASLELEVTEEMLRESPHKAAKSLRKLHDLGVRISLDDFGTGPSCLDQLARLPLDKIKIDQSFIGRLPDDPTSASIVSAALALAQPLGLQVIAEGVENIAQLDFLNAEGCLEAQGYYFSHPLSATDMDQLLAQGNSQIRPWPATQSKVLRSQDGP